MTPTQMRMYKRLQRGPCTVDDLRACLLRGTGSDHTVQVHVSELRKAVGRIGCTVEFDGVYTLVQGECTESQSVVQLIDEIGVDASAVVDGILVAAIEEVRPTVAYIDLRIADMVRRLAFVMQMKCEQNKKGLLTQTSS